MRVLITHDAAVVGGLETRLLEHVAVLRRRGYEVTVAQRRGPLTREFEQLGARIVDIDFSDRSSFASHLEAIRGLLDSGRIDVVDIHPLWSLWPAGIAAMQARVPFVVNLHGSVDGDDSRLLWRSGLRTLGTHASLFVVNSERARRYMLGMLRLAPLAVHLVPNVVSVPTSSIRSVSVPPRRLLLVSRLDPDKTASIACAFRFAAAYAAANLLEELTIVGDGTAAHEIRNLSDELAPGVAKRWLGALVDLTSVYAEADAVLGVGRVVLEAMIRRRPAVVCGVEGNLVGVVAPDVAESWYAGNFAGRGCAAVDCTTVASRLVRSREADIDSLAEWTAKNCGPERLGSWIDALERCVVAPRVPHATHLALPNLPEALAAYWVSSPPGEPMPSPLDQVLDEFSDYQADKEIFIAALKTEIQRMKDNSASVHAELQRERVAQSDELARAARREQQLRSDIERLRVRSEGAERALAEYRTDKEQYIATLVAELEVARKNPMYFVSLHARRAHDWLRHELPSVRRLLPPSVRQWLFELAYEGLPPFESTTTVYFEAENPWPEYPSSVQLPHPLPHLREKVSLIATARNEEASVDAWLASIEGQTRLPDEVIIVDGGSTDGTAHRLREHARRASFDMRVIDAPGANIARGRNIAIRAARYSVIAVTDLGSQCQPRWLELLTSPFAVEQDTEVVAGWYEPLASTAWGSAMALELVPSLAEVDPRSFLPSSRSLAVRKDVLERAGLYPEQLKLTGEDTYLSIALRLVASRWAFVPDARVNWLAPERASEALRKVYAWSWGDGEAGLFPATYAHSVRSAPRDAFNVAVTLPAAPALALACMLWTRVPAARRLIERSRWGRTIDRKLDRTGEKVGIVARWVAALPAIKAARVAGFVSGVNARPALLRRNLGVGREVVIILSGVPIGDSGGGQRAAQLAWAHLQRGDFVVFINRFPSYETKKVKLRSTHPMLYCAPWDEFQESEFSRRYLADDQYRIRVIVEFPLPEFIAMARRYKDRGAALVYDCIDDWSTSLGGEWYLESNEVHFCREADVVVATAPKLQERIHTLSGRHALLVRNAVNIGLFDRTRRYERPADVPPGRRVITYVGALWGSWFDWELLERIATESPEDAVMVIGDYAGQFVGRASNVHFLGLKPQTSLPAYLAYSDVCIIPWRANKLTEAVNPLKVYEYLAMGKPVVATAIDGLRGIPGVSLANTAEQFVNEVARASSVGQFELDAFLAENSWQARLREIDAALGLQAQAGGEPNARAASA